jgi:hypothetical protein
MDADLPLKIVTLLRIVTFMVLVYLGFGLVVEQYSRKPGSQLKAFARIVCSPVTRPVARYLAPGADQRRLLLIGIAIVTSLWAVTAFVGGALRPG